MSARGEGGASTPGSEALCPFGAPARSLFYISDYTNLNHGSFGQCPKEVMAAQHAYAKLAEQHNDRWFRDTYYKLIERSRARVASLIKGRLEDVVLIENASSAVNSVLRSLSLRPGDKVLILSQAYNMVKEVLRWIRECNLQVEVVTVNLQYPISTPDHITDQVRKALRAFGPQIKLCIFSHVSSMPSMVEPIEELARLSKELTDGYARVLVDAAHCPGQVDIDVGSIGADFYLGNMHKWMFAPKGAAFLWAAAAQQAALQPTVISSTGHRDFVGRYSYTGTRDYTAFCSIDDAFVFIERRFGSIRACRDHNHSLAVTGCKMLSSAWGTQLLCAEGMVAGMCNVELPRAPGDRVAAMQRALDERHGIYVVYGRVERTISSDFSVSGANEGEAFNPAFPGDSAGEDAGEGSFIYFLRLSAAVYIGPEAFLKLRDLVPALLV